MLNDAGQKDPVFIVGVPRSGNTLLLRTLLRHGSFAHGRANGTESSAVGLLFAMLDPNGAVPLPLMGFLAGDDLPPDVRRTIVRNRLRRRLVRKLARERAARHPAVWRLAGEHLVVRSFYRNVGRLRNRRVVDKTPWHLHRVEHLLTALPGARFICTYRHPVDVLSSYWRRHAFEGVEWAGISLEEMAQRWAGDVRLAHRFAARFAEAFAVVRYEDLVEAPEPTVRRICEHIGEPFDPASISQFDQAATAQAKGEGPQRWTSRWAENVPAEDAARLERLVSDAMDLAGYLPYTRTQGAVT